MTKTWVFGKGEKKGAKKPIEFVYYIDMAGQRCPPCADPCDYGEVILLFRGHGLDAMLARNITVEYESNGIYLGHWNDGVV